VVRWAAGSDGPAEVLSSVVASQIDAHRPYGGVVPEVAARAHVEVVDTVIAQAMREAGLGFDALDGVAATAGPGLVGGVMVGLSAGKAIALARGLPLVAVNHLEGHAVSARLAARAPYPFLLLLVSGGHCQLLAVDGIGRCARLGSTLDDAAGEAFDKIAATLGLPYPGGPALEALALQGRAGAFELPRMLLGRDGFDFSFSGLKTAAARLAQGLDDLPHGARGAGRHRRAAGRAQRPRHGARSADAGCAAPPVRGGRRGCGQRGGAGAPAGGRRRARLRLRRAAAGLLHRQRRHDRARRG
jgi:glycoprotease/Kae1 family metallohydrolase